MKKIILLSAIAIILYACSGSQEQKPAEQPAAQNDLLKEEAVSEADAAKGIGKFTNVELAAALDAKMATTGKGVYDLKCSACHKLTDEKLVGPGWTGVTSRRTPEWIMNFSTNPSEMLDKDPAAQAMLEECLVRMPSQNLNDDEARAVLEFMRQNDGVK